MKWLVGFDLSFLKSPEGFTNNMKNYLVTGGAGFIGSHVLDRLLSMGSTGTVYVFDDLSTGCYSNLSHHRPNEKLVLLGPHLHSITSVLENVDVVFHLAAAAGVRLIHRSPYDSLVRNAEVTNHLIQQLVSQSKRPHVIFTSSSEVYGPSNWGAVEETISPGPSTNLRWGYAAEKFFAECQLAAAWHARQIPFTVFRLFNIVGPRQSAENNAVLPRFVRSVIRGEQIEIFGEGHQLRSFCHVSDLIDAFMLALLQPDKSTCEVFNVGSNAAIPIRDLAESVLRIGEGMFGYARIAPKYVPFEEVYKSDFDEVKLRCPDVSKLERVLGWERKISLADTIEQVFKHELLTTP